MKLELFQPNFKLIQFLFIFFALFTNLNSALAEKKEFDVSQQKLIAVSASERIISILKDIDMKPTAQKRADEFCKSKGDALTNEPFETASFYNASLSAEGGILRGQQSSVYRIPLPGGQTGQPVKTLSISPFVFKKIICERPDLDEALKQDVFNIEKFLKELNHIQDHHMNGNIPGGNCHNGVCQFPHSNLAQQTPPQKLKPQPKTVDQKNVEDIMKVGHHVQDLLDQGYQADEILVVFDVDGTLTDYSDHVNIKPIPARKNAVQLVNSLNQAGVQLVASSAHENIRETLGKIEDLGLSKAFGAQGPGAPIQSNAHQFTHLKTLQQDHFDVRKQGNVVSIGKPGQGLYLNKGLALAASDLSLAQKNKIKRVIFVDDRKDFVDVFKKDVENYRPFGNQFEGVDYFNLTWADGKSQPKKQQTPKQQPKKSNVQVHKITQNKNGLFRDINVGPNPNKNYFQPLFYPKGFNPENTYDYGAAGGVLYSTAKDSKTGKDATYVLLGKENGGPDRGTWSVMGGSVDRGENFLEAATHEIYEECANVFNIKKEDLRTYPYTVKYNGPNRPGIVSYLINVPFVSGKDIMNSLKAPGLAPHSNEMDDYMWVKLDDLENAMQGPTVTHNSTSKGKTFINNTVQLHATSPGGAQKQIKLRPMTYEIFKASIKDGTFDKMH